MRNLKKKQWGWLYNSQYVYIFRDKAIEYSKSIVRPKVRRENSDETDNDLEVIKE